MYNCVIDVGSGAIAGHSSFGLSTIFLTLSIRPGRASDAVVPAADPEADPPPAIAAAGTAAIAGRGGSGGGGFSCDGVGFSIGNKGYIGTGVNLVSVCQYFWEFTPDSTAG